MSDVNDYFKALTRKSEAEVLIEEQIDAENERFEKSSEYIAHRDTINNLAKQARTAAIERVTNAKKNRPKDIVPPSIDKKGGTSDSKELTAAIEAVKALTRGEKSILFNRMLETVDDRTVEREVPLETTEELHKMLIQMVIDFLNEKKISTVTGAKFSIGNLEGSLKTGTLGEGLTSYLKLESSFTGDTKDEIVSPLKKIVGESRLEG